MKRAALILGLSLALLTGGKTLYAQSNTAPPTESQGLNIEISPARLLLEGSPGKTIDATITVRNRNAGSEKLKIEILKVKTNEDSLELIAPDKNDDFPSWVTFGIPIPFEAPFNQIQKVPITIKIPNTAAFAYDYAIVISQNSAPVVQPGTTQAVEGKVAQFVLLDVIAPGAQRSAAITEFYASKSSYSFLPANLTTVVKNTGNLHVTPTGNIFIKNMSGKQVAALDVNADKGTILPNMARKFENEWNQGFPYYKTEDGKRKLVWNWQDITKFRFGKYTADLVLVYNDGKRDIPITATTTFWVIPWLLILILLVIIILIIVGMALIIRGFVRLVRGDKRHKKRS